MFPHRSQTNSNPSMWVSTWVLTWSLFVDFIPHTLQIQVRFECFVRSCRSISASLLSLWTDLSITSLSIRSSKSFVKSFSSVSSSFDPFSSFESVTSSSTFLNQVFNMVSFSISWFTEKLFLRFSSSRTNSVSLGFGSSLSWKPFTFCFLFCPQKYFLSTFADQRHHTRCPHHFDPPVFVDPALVGLFHNLGKVLI